MKVVRRGRQRMRKNGTTHSLCKGNTIRNTCQVAGKCSPCRGLGNAVEDQSNGKVVLAQAFDKCDFLSGVDRTASGTCLPYCLVLYDLIHPGQSRVDLPTPAGRYA